jgi:hypothetical protein
MYRPLQLTVWAGEIARVALGRYLFFSCLISLGRVFGFSIIPMMIVLSFLFKYDS